MTLPYVASLNVGRIVPPPSAPFAATGVWYALGSWADTVRDEGI